MTFWHETGNGIRYSSSGLATDCLRSEAVTMLGYRAIVRRAYGSLRGVKFGIESEKEGQS